MKATEFALSDGDSGHPLIRTRDIEHHCARGPGVCRVDRIGGSTKLVLDHVAEHNPCAFLYEHARFDGALTARRSRDERNTPRESLCHRCPLLLLDAIDAGAHAQDQISRRQE